MRDFHSTLRRTPFLDRLRNRSVFVPMGRAQGHYQGDSLIAELTGFWTARCSDSELTAVAHVIYSNHGEMFDLAADPRELVNLARTPVGNEVLEWAIIRHRELKRHPDHPDDRREGG